MFPFLSALGQVGGILIDKIVLTRRQVGLHVFVPLLFLFLFFLTVLFFPFLGKISPEILETKNLLLFIVMLLTAIIWNIFYYKGVQSEKVQEFELIIMFQPLLTIILAAIFLKDEQNLHTVAASIIAALALIFAHVQKNHFQLSSGSINLVIAVIFMSVELIFVKLVLEFLSPVALYTIRTGIMFLFFQAYYRPDIFKVCDTNAGLILATAALGTLQMVSKFYGFDQYGVVYTSLILISAPILVYFSSKVFFHEHLKKRTIVSAIVILACIVYATLLSSK